MLHPLAQPQKELQLNLKTNTTQNCQKIELYGSLTTKDLKKPHSSRRVGGQIRGVGWRGKETWCGAERQQWWNGHEWSHIHLYWIKSGRDNLGVSDPSPRPDHSA